MTALYWYFLERENAPIVSAPCTECRVETTRFASEINDGIVQHNGTPMTPQHACRADTVRVGIVRFGILANRHATF
jgi:hypothetical protein